MPGLAAEQLRTAGNLELNHGFTADGEVTLLGARVGGKLSLSGARLVNPGGRALNADRLTVEQGMFCREGFTAEGEVRLLGARITGQLDLSRACLSNPGGKALQANWLTVEQYMLCTEGFTTGGEISLSGAQLAHLDLSGACLTNRDGRTVNGYGLSVTQDIVCRDGFASEGQINLAGARVGGRLALDGARLVNPNGQVLSATRLSVDGDLTCRGDFEAEGETHLSGARIGGSLDLSGAVIHNPGQRALGLEAMTAATLVLLPSRRPEGVDLTNAQVGAFEDDPATWPTTLLMRGFVYENLVNDRVDVRERLRWLTRHPDGYVPQLYDQLAAAYRRVGHEEAARRVAIAKHQRRRSVLAPPGKILNRLLYVTVGYGYRTWLAGAWMLGLLALGTGIFSHAHPTHMDPANRPPAAFHALAYTLDVLLPIVDLGQEKAWRPAGTALYWSWALTGVGWVLTTAVVAGLTSVLRRD